MVNKGENIGDGGGWSRRFGPTMPHIPELADPQVRISKDPGSGIWATWQGKADQRFPYLILQFLDIASWPGDYQFSHFLFATLCDLCCIVVCLCGWWQIAMEMSY